MQIEEKGNVIENREKLRLVLLLDTVPCCLMLILTLSSQQLMMLPHFYTHKEQGEPQHIITCQKDKKCVYMSQQNSEQWLPFGVGAELYSDLYRNHGRQISLSTPIILLPLYWCEGASNQHTELLHCARKNNNNQCCDFHSFNIVRAYYVPGTAPGMEYGSEHGRWSPIDKGGELPFAR